MSVLLWLGVAAIGGSASVARYLVHGAFSRETRRAGRASAGRMGEGGEETGREDFPFGTLAVNLSGSFLLGLLVGAGLHRDAYLLAGTAAVGSYTTFSTWMLDTERLGRAGLPLSAAVNIAAGVAAGVAALLLGRLLAGG